MLAQSCWRSRTVAGSLSGLSRIVYLHRLRHPAIAQMVIRWLPVSFWAPKVRASVREPIPLRWPVRLESAASLFGRRLRLRLQRTAAGLHAATVTESAETIRFERLLLWDACRGVKGSRLHAGDHTQATDSATAGLNRDPSTYSPKPKLR